MPQEISFNQEKNTPFEEASVIRELNLEDTTSATSSDDSWKVEYEAQVQSWRAQSAEAREKAEKERLKWESIRAIEEEEAAKRKVLGIVENPTPKVVQPPAASQDNWQNVGVHVPASTTAASTSQSVRLELGSGLVSSHLVRPSLETLLNRLVSNATSSFCPRLPSPDLPQECPTPTRIPTP